MLVHAEKYTYAEVLKRCSQKPGLTTERQYKGYNVIIHSQKGYGVTYFFYKNNQFVKRRSWMWHQQIEEYYKRYIDNVLMNQSVKVTKED